MSVQNRHLALKLKSAVKDKAPIVFSDLDDTLRWGKDPLSAETKRAISSFRHKGGFLIPITGGPKSHIPRYLIAPCAFSESGAVMLWRQKTMVIAPAEGIAAIESINYFLGIKIRDGPCTILDEYRVIIEGPREACLTIVSGKHSLYPDAETDAPIEKVKNIIQDIVKQHSLPLRIISGIGDGYYWIDINTYFKKEDAVAWFKKTAGIPRAYYLGDGMNDYEAMALAFVTPIGFENSHPKIKELIERRNGIMIYKAGPDGGVSEALEVIT